MSPRSSQRVDRRRRVLVDESRQGESLVGKPRIFRGDSDAPRGRYNSLALQSLNAPLVRYVPLRRYSLLLWSLIGCIPILGLLVLHEWQPLMAQRVGQQATRPFVLGTPGSLGAWFCSAMFVLAVLLVLGIYSVRRHRRDDHRGRFQVWRWGILAAIVASVDSTTGLHHTLQAAGQAAAGASVQVLGIGWLVLYAVVFGAIMIRLLLEMSHAKLAVTWMSLAALCYLWSCAVETNLAGLGDSDRARLSQQAALLVGHHGILLALVSYAREIVLEAMGLITPKTIREREELSTTGAQSADEAASSQRTATARGESAESPAAQGDSAGPRLNVHVPDESSEGGSTQKLSKAERRRLRKEKRKQAA